MVICTLTDGWEPLQKAIDTRAIDVTDYERVVAALRKLSEARGEALMLTDGEGRVVAANRALEVMVGWDARRMTGQPCRRFLRCLDGNAFGTFRASCSKGTASNDGEWVPRKVRTASTHRVVANAKSCELLSEDGKPFGILCTMSLGDRDGMLDQASTRFLSDVSHELRTPLSSLANSIDLLCSNYSSMPKKSLGHMLGLIRHGVFRLHNLVENLLSMSSIQAGAFEVHPRESELESLVGEAVTFVQPILDSRRQRLRVSATEPLEKMVVLVDHRRIVQVIVNLLANASKYGPEGDEIHLSIRRRAREMVISVSERGPGIAHEEQRAIFHRFYRSKGSRQESSSGAGLGLALVKVIVAAHGGRYGVDSEPGAGATFWFTIPVADAQHRSPSQGVQP